MKINKLHKKFSEYGLNAKQWLHKCALMLPTIQKYQVWRHKGFSSIYEYAAKLAGMSKYQVDNSLRIIKKIKDKPELLKIAETKGVNSVRPVVTIATKQNAKFWAEKANKMTKNELEVYVRDIRNQNNQKTQEQAETKTATITMQLEKNLVHKINKYSKGDINKLIKHMLQLYEADLNKKLNQNKPETKKATSSHIPTKIRKFVEKRCQGKCEFPECNNKFKELHHTERLKSVKKHDPDKIIALCKAHHNLAHMGFIDNENQETKFWKIRKHPNRLDLNRYIDDKVQFYRR